MSYPEKMASVLSGLSRDQMRRLRTKGMVVPEVQSRRPPIYSFRDIVALRTVSYLRAKTSLQKLSAAWGNLDMLRLTQHPSEYRFGTDGKTIFVDTSDGPIDLYERPGQINMFTFEEIIESFRGYRDREVPNLHHPHANVEIQLDRIGGQPAVEGTRVQSEFVASLVDYRTIFPEDVSGDFPEVTAEAARDAVNFHQQVAEAR